MPEIPQTANIAHKLTLPTKGLLYPDREKRFPDGQITVASMTTADEKVFSGGGGRSGSRLDTLIQRTCDLKGGADHPMTPDLMTVDDRAFLLVMIRAITYGEIYKFDVKCPQCNRKSRHQLDLRKDLQVTYLDEVMEVCAEPFPFKFPVCGKNIGWRFLRGDDEAYIERIQEKRSKDSVEVGDPAYVYRLARHIEEIDGEKVTAMQAEKWLAALQARDSMAFRNEIERLSPGIDFESEFTCPFVDCREDIQMNMPLTLEFFRPSAR